MARSSAVSAGGQAVEGASDQPKRLVHRPADVADQLQFLERITNRRRARVVERATPPRVVGNEARGSADERVERHTPVVARLRHERQQMLDPDPEAVDLDSAVAGECLGVLIQFLIGGPFPVGGGETPERRVIGRPAPGRLRSRQQPRRPSRCQFVVAIERHVARLEQPAQTARRVVALDPVEQRLERPSGARGHDLHTGAQRHRPVVSDRLLPDEERIIRRCADDLHCIDRLAQRRDPPEHLLDLGLLATGPEHYQCAVVPRRRRFLRRHQQPERRGVGPTPTVTRTSHRCRRGRRRRALQGEPAGNREPGRPVDRGVVGRVVARQRVDEPPRERRPEDVRQRQPRIVRSDGTLAQMLQCFGEHGRRISDLVTDQVPLVGLDERNELGAFVGVREGPCGERAGTQPGHSELAQRRPERRDHLLLQGLSVDATKVARRPVRQVQQQAHDECRPDVFCDRIDAAIDQEGCGRLEREIERCLEPQVDPARAFQGEAIAERMPERVARHDHPLGRGRMIAAKRRELVEEGGHQEAGGRRQKAGEATHRLIPSPDS